jgi:LSD1 subclass zinc finger protein
MSIQITCKDCCSELSYPDAMGGRQVRCFRCDAVLMVPAGTPRTAPPAPVREDRVQAMPPAANNRKQQSQSTASIRETAPVRHEKTRPTRQANKRPPTAPAKRIVEEIGDAEEVVPKEKRGPSRKKRLRRPERQLPVWLWWIIAGSIGLVGCVAMALLVLINLKEEGVKYLIAMAILMPISTGILIASMFISSAVAGGIDFGEARIVIPKAAALLIVINMINLSPCGGFGSAVTLPIWLVGLMTLFKIDVWETRILLVVNWVLNTIVRWVVMSALLSAATHMADRPVDQVADPAEIESLGGQCEYGPDDTVVAIRLRGRHVSNAALLKVINFPDLRSLDLTGSRVTDDGLQYLTDMHQLQLLILTNTRVTNAGVSQLQLALPDVKIVR